MRIPVALLFEINPKILGERIGDMDTTTLVDLYGKEGDLDVRQAMAPELAKRTDLQETIQKGVFELM
jgi:hypothetical protein